MADPEIDLSAGLKPKTPPKTSGIDLSAGMVPKDAGAPAATPPTQDFTTNTHGEGLYEMHTSDGQTIKVPYSKVQDAGKAGYMMKSDARGTFVQDQAAAQEKKLGRKLTDKEYEGLATVPLVPETSGMWGKLRNKVTGWTEPTSLFHGAPSSLSPTDPVTGEAVANVAKRVGRVLFGVPDFGVQAFGALKDAMSKDPEVSKRGEDALLSMHPGAQVVSRVQELKEDAKKDPKLAAENVAGDVIGMWLTDKAVKAGGRVADVVTNSGDGLRKSAQTIVGAGEREVKAHVAGEAEAANTARESTLEANQKAEESTLYDRGVVDEANRKRALADDLARAEAEEKTLKARGVVDESNKKAMDAHADAVREAEEKTLAARGKVDEANKAARLKAKAESVGAQKAANANEPYLEGDVVETSARQEHEANVKRQQDVEAKRTKLTADQATARQNVTTRVQAIYQAAKDYFKQGFEDVTTRLDAPDPETGQVHTVPYADLDEMVDDAEGKIKGSRANVSIFNDIGKKAGGVEPTEKMFPSKAGEPDLAPDEVEALKRMNAAGDELPGAKYSDLDGYYQEAGRVIGNPATAPDVRQAVVKFREALGKRMQKMAEDIDPATAKKHALLRRQYKEYAGGYRNYSGPGGSGSPVAMGLQAQDPYNATRPYEDLEPEEAKRVEKIVTGDSAKPETQFTGKTIVGPDGKEVPAWRFRKQTHAAINDLRNIQKGLDSLPKPEKLAKEVETSAGKLADARAKARETASAKPEQREYPQPLATPTVPTPKPYPEPEATPLETPPREYPQPHATKPIEVPELDSRRIRDELIDAKLKSWTSLSRNQIVRIVAGPIGIVVGAATGHPFIELGSTIYTAAEMTPFVLQKMLDHPGVREWFTKPPTGEIEALQKVPYADRVRIADTFRKIVKEADKEHKSLKLAAPVIAFMAANRGSQKRDSSPSQGESSPADLQKQIEDMRKQLDDLQGAPQ